MDSRTTLKHILLSEGRTQAWLARVTGIDPADLSRIANRGMHPTEDEAKRIAAELGRQVDEVFPELTDECAA